MKHTFFDDPKAPELAKQNERDGKDEGQMTIPYDPKCKDLARHFLGDLASQELVSDLASQIQRTIEDWIEQRQLWTLQELQRGRRRGNE